MWQERAKVGQGRAMGTMRDNNVDMDIAQIALPTTAMKKHNVAACAMASNVQTEPDPAVASRS
jgi:hypothetical protein